MRFLERLKAAWAAFRADDDPINGGHRYAVMSSSDVYAWADAVRLDPMTGEPQWYCIRKGYCELKTKLPSWGILVDVRPDITLEEFRNNASD